MYCDSAVDLVLPFIFEIFVLMETFDRKCLKKERKKKKEKKKSGVLKWSSMSKCLWFFLFQLTRRALPHGRPGQLHVSCPPSAPGPRLSHPPDLLGRCWPGMHPDASVEHRKKKQDCDIGKWKIYWLIKEGFSASVNSGAWWICLISR